MHGRSPPQHIFFQQQIAPQNLCIVNQGPSSPSLSVQVSTWACAAATLNVATEENTRSGSLLASPSAISTAAEGGGFAAGLIQPTEPAGAGSLGRLLGSFSLPCLPAQAVLLGGSFGLLRRGLLDSAAVAGTRAAP